MSLFNPFPCAAANNTFYYGYANSISLCNLLVVNTLINMALITNLAYRTLIEFVTWAWYWSCSIFPSCYRSVPDQPRPPSPVYYPADRSAGNAELAAKLRGRISPRFVETHYLGNLTCLQSALSTKFPSVTIAEDIYTMPQVLASGDVLKICQSIVTLLPILVVALNPRFLWPNEGGANNCMNKVSDFLAFPKESDTRISQSCYLWFHGFLVNSTPHVSEIANSINSLISRYISPLFHFAPQIKTPLPLPKRATDWTFTEVFKGLYLIKLLGKIQSVAIRILPHSMLMYHLFGARAKMV